MLFEIRALGADQRVNLRLEAADPSDAADQARLQGLTVLDVRPAARLGSLSFARRARFPLSLFSRELLALLHSGLSLVEALQTLEEKESRPETRKILGGVLKHLYEGESFSTAIGHSPDAFPPLYVATVRAAERTSDLPQALSRYVAYQDQVEQVRKKVLSASIYPIILMVVGALVALFLLGFVTPRFASIYADNTDRLPWASRVLMQWGGFVEAHAVNAGLLLLVLLGAAGYAFSRPRLRAWIARQLWRLPGLGEPLRIFQLTRFYRTVGMLLSGGIPVVTALEMAGGLLQPELRLRLASAAATIREGQSVSQAMERAGLVTPVALRMLRVGEKSGRMGDMMEAIATFHEEETSRFVDWFPRLFEPILMAVIGLVIGIIVVMLYLPIFELAGSLE
ncbi:MAG: type II secretion system F family protein [Anderseniella sp.]|jgi:general secretion pathway protein F|nr:type II secretion system F family protein [Anderseniella sp.]